MWVLQLNDMRHAHGENLTPVARAETREALMLFMERERVDGYDDAENHPYGGTWRKGFRRGGPLEWCNGSFDDEQSIVNVGTRADWMTAAGERWDRQVASLMAV